MKGESEERMRYVVKGVNEVREHVPKLRESTLVRRVDRNHMVVFEYEEHATIEAAKRALRVLGKTMACDDERWRRWSPTAVFGLLPVNVRPKDTTRRWGRSDAKVGLDIEEMEVWSKVGVLSPVEMLKRARYEIERGLPPFTVEEALLWTIGSKSKQSLFAAGHVIDGDTLTEDKGKTISQCLREERAKYLTPNEQRLKKLLEEVRREIQDGRLGAIDLYGLGEWGRQALGHDGFPVLLGWRAYVERKYRQNEARRARFLVRVTQRDWELREVAQRMREEVVVLREWADHDRAWTAAVFEKHARSLERRHKTDFLWRREQGIRDAARARTEVATSELTTEEMEFLDAYDVKRREWALRMVGLYKAVGLPWVVRNRDGTPKHLEEPEERKAQIAALHKFLVEADLHVVRVWQQRSENSSEMLVELDYATNLAELDEDVAFGDDDFDADFDI